MASRRRSQNSRIATIGKPSKHSIPIIGHDARFNFSKHRPSIRPAPEPKRDGSKETFAFKILTNDQTREVNEISDVDSLQERVAAMMNISDSDIDLKAGATLDYYVSALWWAKEEALTLEQMSAFFTVVYTCLENVRDKQYSLVDTLREFKQMFTGVGAQEAPLCTETPLPDQTTTTAVVPTETPCLVDCLDVDIAKKVVDYMQISLFQHYQLYEFLFSHTQAEEIIGTDLDVEVPFEVNLPWPPPLEEAFSEQLHIIATTLPTPSVSEETEATEKGEGEQIEELDTAKVKDILSELSADQVMTIINGVVEEMLGGLKDEVAVKLREKENAFITRINKIHRKAGEGEKILA